MWKRRFTVRKHKKLFQPKASGQETHYFRNIFRTFDSPSAYKILQAAAAGSRRHEAPDMIYEFLLSLICMQQDYENHLDG